eukprot:365286-Chlamydomonas_euryale.AAC.3
MSLSAPALFAPFVRLELLHWDPLYADGAPKRVLFGAAAAGGGEQQQDVRVHKGFDAMQWWVVVARQGAGAKRVGGKMGAPRAQGLWCHAVVGCGRKAGSWCSLCVGRKMGHHANKGFDAMRWRVVGGRQGAGAVCVWEEDGAPREQGL